MRNHTIRTKDIFSLFNMLIFNPHFFQESQKYIFRQLLGKSKNVL